MLNQYQNNAFKFCFFSSCLQTPENAKLREMSNIEYTAIKTHELRPLYERRNTTNHASIVN